MNEEEIEAFNWLNFMEIKVKRKLQDEINLEKKEGNLLC